ncbi:MAG TPA: hypothetical protein VEA69_00155 [Tepidisphaeraceae bacterium]|nr:hypothetical protein [Tepidisphaeraceae bacterium]
MKRDYVRAIENLMGRYDGEPAPLSDEEREMIESEVNAEFDRLRVGEPEQEWWEVMDEGLPF